MRRTCAQTASGTLLSQTVEDGFGRVIEETTPTTTGSITTRSEYNERGQLIRRTRTDGSTEQAPTLYEYDSMGRISRQITALNGTPTPENSAIVEYAYSAEPADDGLVYAVTRTTRYNAAGEALTSEEKTLISALDPVLESASLRIDERGNATATRTEYAGGATRLTLTELPGCAAPARSLSIDGFTTEQTDAAGVTTRAARRYTATGMELTQTDGRGNTTTQVTDIAGRTLRLTDAAGATTTTTYAATSDQPATVTDALGNTARYRYDVRGRKVAEWGTAIQPALYAYDDTDRLTALTTFRAEGTSRTTDPSSRTDGDTTTWTYDEATGLELTKRYADGSIVTKTYDSFGNPATETNARGIVTSYEYDSFRNLLLAIRYSDDTEDETFTYNHLGQLTQVTDAAGTRTISYNRYGEAETDSLLAGTMTHTITEQRDTLGRSTGYVYAKNDIPQQQTSIGYGADGRIASAGFTHQGEHKEFSYSYLPGTHLLHTLTHPNGLTLTQSYDNDRDLPTDMSYSRADALVVRRSYDYDLLGRPTARNLARYGTETQDSFGYNTRSELTTAHVNSADYSYAYDAIGNRTSATEAGTRTAYTANKLNQYTAEGSFKPTFDADGNQTVIKTSTGTWSVTYNAKNRPVLFAKSDGSVTVECTYDTMGRRATKKVTTNGTLTEHRRFLYRGYLQIACCDLTRAYTPALWFITWDPTQETATRPLAIQKNGTWYTYGWDLTKNICETYRTDGRIDLAYTYTPYGEVSPAHAYDQPLRWSSEYHDVELGLVYYNYRHYNPAVGRWMGRDMIGETDNVCLYAYLHSSPTISTDILGLTWSSARGNEALYLLKKLRHSNEKLNTSHPCACMAKSAANGACITFAAGVIECAYRLSGDIDIAEQIAQLHGNDSFNAESLSKVLTHNGWALVIYARDIRRVITPYPHDSDLKKDRNNDEKFVSGDGITGTFGAIHYGVLYGIPIAGAIYNLRPYSIRKHKYVPWMMREDNNEYKSFNEKFAFISQSNGFHVGILSNNIVYDYEDSRKPIASDHILTWITLRAAAQIGWLMLPPDSQNNIPQYADMMSKIKNYKQPEIRKKQKVEAHGFIH